jgi:DNA-binding PadR family transcriptional regulator
MHAIGRHSGFRSGGRAWHGGRGGGRHGGSGLRAARVLSASDLQLLIIALLEERPRHGYDLIKAIQELTGGAYMPSPGMVYPALSYLEESGLAALEPDGAKKLYRLTEAGASMLRDNRARLTSLLDALKRIGQRLGKARELFEQSEDPKTAAQDAAGHAGTALEAARRDLKAVLFDNLDAPPEEQQRIAEILQQTIAQIRKR